MLTALSNVIYKGTNRYTVIFITAVFCLYVFWILPNSRDVDRIVGTGAALIVPFFEYLLYTPQDFYSQLKVYGAEGREAFADYRVIQATLWLLTLGAFLALTTSALLRVFTAADSGQRQLNLVAPLPSIFDYLENQLQIILVGLYPERYDGLALLAAGFTAIKWVTLLAAFIILFYALVRASFATLARRWSHLEEPMSVTKKSISIVGVSALLCSLLPLSAIAHDEPGAHSRNVSSRCYELANAWLDSLDAEQKKLAQYEFNEMAEPERLFSEMEKRRKWHYLNSIPTVYQRQEGVALKDMTSEQRILAHKFVQCGLSSQGYFKAANIMIGEKVGWETLPDQGIKDSLKFGAIGGSGAYWLAIFGEPSRTEPWQWQMEGHHLALSFTMVGDEVGSTPVFWGTRPTVVLEGMYAGWHLMGYEKEYAYRLMSSLDKKQKRKALIAKEMSENIFTDPNRLDVFEEYEGLPGSDMSVEQQEMLRDVIREYVNNNDHEIASARMAEIEADGIENVYFSWMGPTNDIRYPIYFRVHGPSVIIEFVNAVNHGGDKGGVPLDEDGNVIPGDHNIPDSNHIHSVYRKPGADFGDDLLREHYLNDPAHNGK